jgi:hypothetical protein
MCAVSPFRPGLSHRGRRQKRRWSALRLVAVIVLSLGLYFLGLELWELWALALLVLYLGWIFRQ